MAERKDFPEPSSLQTEAEVLAVRASLPRLKAGDPLQGYKWSLTLRLRALRNKRAGPLAPSLILSMVAEAGPYCPICDRLMEVWTTGLWPTVDHIVALANGGTNERSNLRVICNRCNSRKGARA